MVDPIFFTAAATAVSLLVRGASTLKARYQLVKATKEETQLLDEFLCNLQNCAAQYQIDYGATLKPRTATSTKTSFLKTLEDAQKKLDKWSSQNSGFFSQRSSGERLRKLRALRDRVHRALEIEMFRMTASILGHLKHNKQTHTGPPKSRFEPAGRSQHGHVRPTTKTTDDVSTHRRSISTGRPSKQQTSHSSRSTSVQRDRHDSTHQGQPKSRFEPAGRSQYGHVTKTTNYDVSTPVRSFTSSRASTSSSTHPTRGSSGSGNVHGDRHASSHQVEKKSIIELWVPCDSWKQWNDVKENLERKKGIKKSFFDLETKQMRVELEEWSKIDKDALIKAVQLELPKDKKVAPRPW